ncbi:MAG: NUDIX domain-containing protein [Paludibacter sp.]|nr:NUDIX domain-containing protein [Paludibacter sp.]
MRFKYCPDCGHKLIDREIGDEGLIPYCEHCEKPLFDMFSTCVIALVVNEFEEALLLRQNYISTVYRNLISGYMKPGERAEDAAMREIEEETGITPDSLQFLGTYWFAKKDMLMIGFMAKAQKSAFNISKEVDEAQWIPVEQAIKMVHPKGSVSYALLEKYMSNS